MRVQTKSKCAATRPRNKLQEDSGPEKKQGHDFWTKSNREESLRRGRPVHGSAPPSAYLMTVDLFIFHRAEGTGEGECGGAVYPPPGSLCAGIAPHRRC